MLAQIQDEPRFDVGDRVKIIDESSDRFGWVGEIKTRFGYYSCRYGVDLLNGDFAICAPNQLKIFKLFDPVPEPTPAKEKTSQIDALIEALDGNTQ